MTDVQRPQSESATFAAHRPDGALIFQQMSALAQQAGSANYAQGIPEAVYDEQWRSALAEASLQHHFQYVPSRGLPQLRETIADTYTITAANAVVTSGCTESLTSAMLTLAKLGAREVVVTEPFYSFYPGMAHYAGLPCRCVPMLDDGHRWDFPVDQLVSLMVSAAERGEQVVVLVNSPHNPTGALLDNDGWSALVNAAEQSGSWLLVDDAYRDFVFAGQLPDYAHCFESERVLIAGSISKSLAAAGNRVGWLLAPESLLDSLDDAHMHQSYCTPGLMQLATVEVWRHAAGDTMSRVAAAYARRAASLTEALTELGCAPRQAAGGFFVTSRPPQGWQSAASGVDVATQFTEAYAATPLPLDPFFANPDAGTWLRWSCTLPDEIHRSAIDRLG